MVDSLGRLDRVEKAAEVGCSLGYSTEALLEKADEVVATEIDIQALYEAADRLARHYSRLHLIQASCLTVFRAAPLFDLVVTNPPYLPDVDSHDTTVDGGPTGVEMSLAVLGEASQLLRPNGAILLIGSTLSDLSTLMKRARGMGLEPEETGRIKLFFEELVCWLFRRSI
ncbi:MAG: methyltransferase [Nitrososphaerota archaeon]